MQRIRQLELRAAATVGVSAVFAEDDRLAMLPSFADFLQRAVADGTTNGRVGGGRFSRLPLRVQRQDFRTDALAGLLAVPVSATAAELRSYVEVSSSGCHACGPACIHQMAVHKCNLWMLPET